MAEQLYCVVVEIETGVVLSTGFETYDEALNHVKAVSTEHFGKTVSLEDRRNKQVEEFLCDFKKLGKFPLNTENLP